MEIIIDGMKNAQLEIPTEHFSIIDKLNHVWFDDSIVLSPNIVITLGELNGNGNKEYNKFVKLSISLDEEKKSNLSMTRRDMKAEEIVLTLWPKKKKIIPAQVRKIGHNIEIELAGEARKDERCFVLNEDASRFYTVSMASTTDKETNIIKLVQPRAIESWLSSQNALYEQNDRFAVSRLDYGFEISDSKKKRKYMGSLKNNEELFIENELYSIKRTLESKGLGAILPIYSLQIHSV
jgi:hypothetical protein